MKNRCICFLIALSFGYQTALADDFAHLVLHRFFESGEITSDITYSSLTSTDGRIFDNTGTLLEFGISSGNTQPFFLLLFSTADTGTPIDVGTYTNTQGFFITGFGGASLSNKQSTFNFTIADLLAIDGKVQRFAGLFEINHGGATGTFALNDPDPVPEPSTLALLTIWAVGLLAVRRG